MQEGSAQGGGPGGEHRGPPWQEGHPQQPWHGAYCLIISFAKKRGELLLLFVNNDRTCSQVPTLGLPALTGPQQALAPQASLQTALQQQLAASAALGENNMFLHISVYIVK